MEILDVLENKRSDVNPALLTLIENSIEVLTKAIQNFGENLALSFNGGKDCTVVLHLLRAASLIEDRQSKEETSWLQRIKYVHFVKENEFEEIEQFRNFIEHNYNIKVQLYSSDFKGEVQKLIDQHGIEGIIMGNRKSDPWSRELEPICKSSPGWPEFFRVFPILDWSYHNVWEFLRFFDLPYCKLYDLGYTSLGEKDNSIRNPHLRVEKQLDSGEIIEEFNPAYQLENDEYERESRIKAPVISSPPKDKQQ